MAEKKTESVSTTQVRIPTWPTKKIWESCRNCEWWQPTSFNGPAESTRVSDAPAGTYPGFCRAGHPFPVVLHAHQTMGQQEGSIDTLSDGYHFDTLIASGDKYWCRYWRRAKLDTVLRS